MIQLSTFSVRVLPLSMDHLEQWSNEKQFEQKFESSWLFPLSERFVHEAFGGSYSHDPAILKVCGSSMNAGLQIPKEDPVL